MRWDLAAWGVFGGFAVEGLDFYRAFYLRRRAPWQFKGRARRSDALLYFVVTLIRLGIGGGLALAAAESDQVTTPLAAVAVGVAAPLIVERLLGSIELVGPVAPQELERRAADAPVRSRSGAAGGSAGDGP